MWEHNADCSNVGVKENDKMKSCIVYCKDGVTFYADDMYRGDCVTLTKGSYTKADLEAYGVPDNWMTSLAIPDGWNVRVFSEDNFTGDSWPFSRGTHNVGAEVNDQMTSVKIF